MDPVHPRGGVYKPGPPSFRTQTLYRDRRPRRRGQNAASSWRPDAEPVGAMEGRGQPKGALLPPREYYGDNATHPAGPAANQTELAQSSV